LKTTRCSAGVGGRKEVGVGVGVGVRKIKELAIPRFASANHKSQVTNHGTQSERKKGVIPCFASANHKSQVTNHGRQSGHFAWAWAAE